MLSDQSDQSSSIDTILTAGATDVTTPSSSSLSSSSLASSPTPNPSSLMVAEDFRQPLLAPPALPLSVRELPAPPPRPPIPPESAAASSMPVVQQPLGPRNAQEESRIWGSREELRHVEMSQLRAAPAHHPPPPLSPRQRSQAAPPAKPGRVSQPPAPPGRTEFALSSSAPAPENTLAPLLAIVEDLRQANQQQPLDHQRKLEDMRLHMRLSKFLVTIETRGVEKILASFNFLLPLFLLIPLEAFFQQL